MHEVSGDPTKSQLIETRKHAAEQACTMFRTPPQKIGIIQQSARANVEQQSIDYVTGPISALARSIEAAVTIACLTPPERLLYKVEHNLEGLMRGDILSRYSAYAIGRQWGWLSVNKILERENENGIGPDGDEYLVPLNMVPGGGAKQAAPGPRPSAAAGRGRGPRRARASVARHAGDVPLEADERPRSADSASGVTDRCCRREAVSELT
jgi:hypothetical protein